MAYQLSDLITEVQRKAKDTSFSSALITDYLNDTQDEVLGTKLWSFQETTATATLGDTETTYSYPADLQLVLGVTLTDPDSSTLYYTPGYLSHREFFARTPKPSIESSGAPGGFTDYGRSLYWDRPLDKDYSLSLRYLKRPTVLSGSTDVPSIPQEFKAILIRGALAGVEEYRENFDIAAVHRRKIEDLVEDMTIRYSFRQLMKLPKARPLGRIADPWSKSGYRL